MSGYLLRVRGRFEAAHHLHSYRGAPEASHGHSWRVEVGLRSDGLDSEGMAYDFVKLKGALDALAGELDHRDLNALPAFDRAESDDRAGRGVVLRAPARLPCPTRPSPR